MYAKINTAKTQNLLAIPATIAIAMTCITEDSWGRQLGKPLRLWLKLVHSP